MKEEGQKKQLQRLRKIADSLSVFDFLDHRVFIKAVYDALKEHDNGYSHKQFAEELGIPKPNFTIEAVNGTTRLTVGMTRKIAVAMGLDPPEASFLVGLAEFINAKEPSAREASFSKLVRLKHKKAGSGQIEGPWRQIFSEWHHLAIFELLGLTPVPDTPAKIQRKLLPRLRPHTIQKSLDLLMQLGLVQESGGLYSRTVKTIDTGPEIDGLTANQFHQQMLDLGKTALALTSGSERDISSLTINLTEQDIARVKKRIHALQDEVLQLSAVSGAKDRVYQMNIQFFPLTRTKKSKSKGGKNEG